MKILHIYNDYFPPVYGGIEKHINSVCEGLKNKFEMQVLTAGEKHKTKTSLINGVPVTRIFELGRFQSAPLCPTMPYWLKKAKSDIYHFHLPCPTGMISWFLTRPKGKLIITYHSDIVRQKWAKSIYGPILNRFLKAADKIIATSPNYIESSPFLSKFRNKCVVIPIGINISKYHEKESAGKIILFVGRLRKYKGLEYLIEAMEKIDAKLMIIGKGREEEQLRNFARKKNVTAKIEFVGDVIEEKLPEYYANCSVFVLPSIERSEAYGISQMEAMASGKPVISTALDTGVPWVNIHNLTGIIVPPKNADALSNAINEILADKTLRMKLGNNAKKRANSEFSKEKMLEKLIKFYESL